jgi:hypothetical protein
MLSWWGNSVAQSYRKFRIGESDGDPYSRYACMQHKKYSFAHALNHRPFSRIDILSWAEVGFELDANFIHFPWLLSLLVSPAFLPFSKQPSCTSLTACTLSDSACAASHVATAEIHATGWMDGSCLYPRVADTAQWGQWLSSPPLLATAAAPRHWGTSTFFLKFWEIRKIWMILGDLGSFGEIWGNGQ